MTVVEAVGTSHLLYEKRANETVKRYDQEIRYLDSQMEALLEYLDASGFFEECLLILTVDHGEALREDDFHSAHSHGLGLGQAHVLLLFLGKGVPTREVDTPVSTTSIFATIMVAMGESSAGVDGTGLWSEIEEGRDPEASILYAEGSHHIAIVK